jgi:hypothetical protein
VFGRVTFEVEVYGLPCCKAAYSEFAVFTDHKVADANVLMPPDDELLNNGVSL